MQLNKVVNFIYFDKECCCNLLSMLAIRNGIRANFFLLLTVKMKEVCFNDANKKNIIFGWLISKVIRLALLHHQHHHHRQHHFILINSTSTDIVSHFILITIMNSSVFFLFIYLFRDSCKSSATDAMSKLKPKCIMTKCLATATTAKDINAVLRVSMKEIVCKLRWHSNNIIFISENVILTDEVYRSPQGYFVQLGLQ